MPEIRSGEIDSLEDFKLIEFILKGYESTKKLLLKKIESYNLVKKFRNLLPNGKIAIGKE